MAESLLAVKSRLNTVASIRKITKAMKLIASSRYSRLKNQYDGTKEYVKGMSECMNQIVNIIDFDKMTRPTCMTVNPGDTKLVIFVTPTLGLCGSYYYNLQKIAKDVLTEKDDVVFIGEKGYRYFKDKVHKADTKFIHLLDNLTFDNVNVFRHYIDKLYRENKYRSIDIIYTRYINSFMTKAVCEQVLPLEQNSASIENMKSDIEKGSYDLLFEGHPDQVVDLIVPHYLDAILYKYFLESGLSEHTSRRNSMESATSSADSLIEMLKLQYNKARQQKITNEITEIIAGSNSSR